MANERTLRALLRLGIDKKSIDAAKKAIDGVEKELNELGNAAKKAGKSTGDFAKNAKADFEKLDKGAKKTGTSFDAMAGKLAAGVAALGLTAAAQQFLTDSFRMAGAAERLGNATENLGKRFGVTGDQIVSSIQTASGGTIDQLTAMKAANQAMLLGIVQSEEQFAELAEIGVVLGRAMGQDAAKSIEDITVGVGRQSKLILDNLGIIIDTEKAYEQYAATLGKTADELDDNEKKQAFINATLEQGREKVEELGGITNDQVSDVERLTAAWIDFQVAFGGLLSDTEQGIGVFDSLTDLLNNLAGGAEAWSSAFENMGVINDFMSVDLSLSTDIEEWKAYGNAILEAAIPFDNMLEALAEFNRVSREGDFDLINGPIEATQAALQKLVEPLEGVSALYGVFTDDAEVANKALVNQYAELNAARAAGVAKMKEYTGEQEAETETTDEATVTQEEYADALEKVNDAYNEADIRNRRQVLDAEIDLTRELADLTDEFHRKRQEAEDDYHQERFDTVEDANQELMEIERDYILDVLDAEERFSQQRQDIAEKNADSIADIHRRAAQRIADASQDMEQGQQDIERDTERDLADVDRELAQERIDIEINYQREIRRIRQQFANTAEEAVRNQDAIGFLRAKRQQEQALQEAKQNRNDNLQDARTNAQRRREEIRIQREQELEDERIANERKMEELRIQLERELQEQRIQHEREMEQQRQEEERKLEQLAQAKDREIQQANQKTAQKLQDLAEEYSEEQALINEQEDQKREELIKNHERELEDLNRHYQQRKADIQRHLADEIRIVQNYAQSVQNAMAAAQRAVAATGGGRLGGMPMSGLPVGIGRRASGGYAGSGIYALGEQGKEFVMSNPVTEQMERAFGTLTQDKMQRIGDMAMSNTFNFSERDDARQILGQVEQIVNQQLVRMERGY